ncbi:MAG: hypothetical protein L3J76_01485, partial [Candidatus Hydrothermae bacterium]|nr:hypothetical protein [Candidatus Hydrothermae bacterium]
MMISLRRLRILWGLSAVRDALLVLWIWGMLGGALGLIGLTLPLAPWMIFSGAMSLLALLLHPALRPMPDFLRFLSRRHPPMEDRLLSRWELARAGAPAFFLHRLDQEIQARLGPRQLDPPSRWTWIALGLALTLAESLSLFVNPRSLERWLPSPPREVLAWSPPLPGAGETLRVLRSAEPDGPLYLNGLPLEATPEHTDLKSYRIPLVRPGTLLLEGTLHRVRLPVLPRPDAEGFTLRLDPPPALPLSPVERPWGGTAWLVEGGRVVLQIQRTDTLQGWITSWD